MIPTDEYEVFVPGGAGEDEEPPTDLQSLVQRSLERAVSYAEEHIEPDQVKATEYYHGRPFGDEEEGRSKVVSTDVRDVTLAQLPSLMRIFFGPERVVEYAPRTQDKIQMARQATDYVNFILTQDNPGFLTYYSLFKDALVRRLGVAKWYHETRSRLTSDIYGGLSEEQLELLAAEEGVELEILDAQQGPPSSERGATVIYSARVTRQEEEDRFRVVAVPPDEFVFSPGARDLDTAPLVAHVRDATVDELLGLGIDRELILEAQGQHRALDSGDLDETRQISGSTDWPGSKEDRDTSQLPVLYAEAYMLVDGEDGRSELRMFQCVGPKYTIANDEGTPVDEVPFAVFSPDPEPHTIIGLGNFDMAGDVQLVKSHILRRTLDSLSQAVEPVKEVVEGEVNLQDLLNPDILGIIRVRKPGMLREIKHTFVGGDTLPVLEYYDEIKENRTQISKASAGLDADSLQSSTKAAVTATLTAAQQRLELIARLFAETGMRRLYSGLLRLIIKHQHRPRIAKLRGEYVEVDPRSWDATLDVEINLALGQGTPEDKVAMFQGVLDAQRELMGSGSPLVSWVEIRNALAQLAELIGIRNIDRYFKPWTEDNQQQLEQAMQNAPPQPGEGDAMAQAYAQAEELKNQVKMQEVMQRAQEAQARLALDYEKLRLEDDRERDRVAREMELRRLEIEMKYRTQIQTTQMNQQIELDRARMDADQIPGETDEVDI